MDERREVDCYVFMRLVQAGYDPKFGTTKHDVLHAALRNASKDFSKKGDGDHPGIVDLYVWNDEWIILVEDKNTLNRQLRWDERTSPYRSGTPAYGSNHIMLNAENGILHYMCCIHDDWPEGVKRPKHILGLAISMESLDLCLQRPYYLDMETGEAVRMPLIKDLMEIKKSKLRAYFQLARTSFSLDNLDPEEKLLAFMRDKASIDDVDSVLTTLFLAKGNPYFHLPRHGTLKAMNKHYAEMAYCMFQRQIEFSFSQDAVQGVIEAIDGAMKSGADLDAIGKRMDDLAIVPTHYWKLWLDSLDCLDGYWRETVMASMLEIDAKSSICDPLCLDGSTLAACETVHPSSCNRAFALMPESNVSRAVTTMMLFGMMTIDVTAYQGDWQYDRIEANRIVSDLVWAESDAWEYIEAFLKAARRNSICVFAVTAKALKDPRYEDCRALIVGRYTLESIVKVDSAQLIRIRRSGNQSVRTVCQDFSKLDFSEVSKRATARPVKGSRLIKGGNWLK